MPKTILIVDDDPNILDTVKDILEDAGYAVETASTGAAAIQKLETGGQNLAIIDFNLPDGKGPDLAIKAKTLCPALVILLMTGEAHVDLGAAKGAIHSTLTKPVDPAQLLSIIRKNS